MSSRRGGISLNWITVILVILAFVILLYNLLIGIGLITGIITAIAIAAGKKKSLGKALGADFILFVVLAIIYTVLTPSNAIFNGVQVPVGGNVTVTFLTTTTFIGALVASLIFTIVVYKTYEMGRAGKTVEAVASS